MPVTTHPVRDGELGLVDLVRADYAALRGAGTNTEPGASRLRLTLDILTWPGFVAVVIYRVAHAAHKIGLLPVSRALTYLNLVLHSFEMHPKVIAGPGLVVLHPQGSGCAAGVRIGRRCRMTKGVTLGAGGFDDPSVDGFPVVGDDVVFGEGSSAWGPVSIGDRALIGAGVRLFRSVPSDSKVVLAQRQMVLDRQADPKATRPHSVPEPRM
jgi:serine O-acetyltransferase